MVSGRQRARSRKLAAVLWIALVVRVALPLAAYTATGGLSGFLAPDSGSYLRCAESLSRGEGFSNGGAPELARTPGFPLLLLPGVILGRPVAVTVGLQALIGVFTVWLVYRLTVELAGRSAPALAAALLAAFEPLSVLYCGILLAETLFAMLLMLFLCCLAVGLRTRRAAWFAAAGLALSAAVYARPVAYWLPLVTAVVLVAAACVRADKRRELLRGALTLAAVCIVCLGAWQVRNRRETGYGGFSSITDYYLYFYQGAAVLAAESGRPYYAVQRELGYNDPAAYLARHPEQAQRTRAERLAAMGREGRAIIRSHPRVFALIYARGMARTLLDPGAVDYLKMFKLYPEGSGLLGEAVDRGVAATVRELARRRPLVFFASLALGIVLLAYMGLAVAGLFRPAARPTVRAALIVTGAYLLLLAGGANALGRFRLPLMPIICVFAGCGADILLLRRSRKPNRDAF